MANIAAVRSGRVTSALIQGDIAGLAYQGAGPFQSAVRQDLRILAKLQRETVHLVVATKSRVKRLSDLKGKRIAIDGPSSATNVTARSILAAGEGEHRGLKLSYQSPDQAAADLKAGKIDCLLRYRPRAAARARRPAPPRFGAARADRRPRHHRLAEDATVLDGDRPAGRGLSRRQPIHTLSVVALWVATAKLPDDVAY